MSKGGPDLKKYMDKRLAIKLNANRNVVGILRGFDQVRHSWETCEIAHQPPKMYTQDVFTYIYMLIESENSMQNCFVLQFMNLVLDETVEVVSTTEKTDIGMVVRKLRTPNV